MVGNLIKEGDKSECGRIVAADLLDVARMFSQFDIGQVVNFEVLNDTQLTTIIGPKIFWPIKYRTQKFLLKKHAYKLISNRNTEDA